MSIYDFSVSSAYINIQETICPGKAVSDWFKIVHLLFFLSTWHLCYDPGHLKHLESFLFKWMIQYLLLTQINVETKLISFHGRSF